MSHDEILQQQYALLAKWEGIAGRTQYAHKNALDKMPRTDWCRLRRDQRISTYLTS